MVRFTSGQLQGLLSDDGGFIVLGANVVKTMQANEN